MVKYPRRPSNQRQRAGCTVHVLCVLEVKASQCYCTQTSHGCKLWGGYPPLEPLKWMETSATPLNDQLKVTPLGEVTYCTFSQKELKIKTPSNIIITRPHLNCMSLAWSFSLLKFLTGFLT